MEKRHFQRLLASIREMKLIQKGKLKPARVTRISLVSIKEIRQKLNQSQSEFAFMIGVSPSTLRNWEQGVRRPDGPARVLLQVVAKRPDAVFEALHG